MKVNSSKNKSIFSTDVKTVNTCPCRAQQVYPGKIIDLEFFKYKIVWSLQQIIAHKSLLKQVNTCLLCFKEKTEWRNRWNL